MKTFTKEQYETLTKQAKKIIDRVVSNESAREIMVRLYVDNLEDKTRKQGEVMADAIIEQVKNFDADYKDAKENLSRFISKFQDEIDAGKTGVERCNYWLKFAAAISAANIAMGEDGVDRAQILKDIEALSVSEDQATPQLENELREKAKTALENSGVMLSGLMAKSKEIEELAEADEAAGMLIDLGNEEIGYRAILSMLAYTKIKNGEFDNMPADMTAVQVATVVCAEVEQTRINEAVSYGSLAVDIASELLLILGALVLVRMAIFTVNAGIALAGVLFSTIFAIPACLMVIAGTLHVFKKAFDAWSKDSRTIVKTTVAGIKALSKGAVAVWHYAKEKVWPKLVETGKIMISALTALFNKAKTTPVRTTVEQPAN